MRVISVVFGLLCVLPAPLVANADETRVALATHWYSDVEVTQGRDVFQAHCAACHGERAQGARGWDSGAAVPPPLNGSGHVAHHSLDQLLGKIEQGGLMGNGRMPPFGQVLGASERRAALAYVQSLWPDDIYRDWQAAQDSGKHHH